MCRHENDFHARIGGDNLLQDFHTVQFGHHEITQHYPWQLLVKHVEACLGVSSGQDVQPGLLQSSANELKILRIVVNRQQRDQGMYVSFHLISFCKILGAAIAFLISATSDSFHGCPLEKTARVSWVSSSSSESVRVLAVSTKIGKSCHCGCSRMRLMTSKPSISGICKSNRTRSTRIRAKIDKASFPLRARMGP